mmetsp:Transcript_27634/g.33594  ORF Transcript_27634/g.33594 Transcript_27634/m.33594 type:complete len:232 (+) Transcript_27634:123-818(+)
MTGVANVTNDTSFDELQSQFIERLHATKCSAALKSVWQNVCVCKAGIEITLGDKQKAEQIHKSMIAKYMKWADLLLKTPDEVVTGEIPGYVTDAMMKTADVKGKKRYGEDDGKKMWSKWHRLKKDILNRDNLAVKKAIARMPNGVLPSRTDFSIFLNRVVYELYMVKEAAKNNNDKAVEKDDDYFDEVERNNIGGLQQRLQEILPSCHPMGRRVTARTTVTQTVTLHIAWY